MMFKFLRNMESKMASKIKNIWYQKLNQYWRKQIKKGDMKKEIKKHIAMKNQEMK